MIYIEKYLVLANLIYQREVLKTVPLAGKINGMSATQCVIVKKKRHFMFRRSVTISMTVLYL